MNDGTKDRLSLCGQAACEALGLDEHNDDPNSVRAAINRLRKERGEFECRAILAESTFAERDVEIENLKSEIDRLEDELADLRGSGWSQLSIADRERLIKDATK